MYYTDSLPNTTTVTLNIPGDVPIQNLNSNFLMTLCYGTASLPQTSTPGTGDYFSFMAQGDSRISFTVSDTTFTITTTTDLSSYKGVFVFEYIKNA